MAYEAVSKLQARQLAKRQGKVTFNERVQVYEVLCEDTHTSVSTFAQCFECGADILPSSNTHRLVELDGSGHTIVLCVYCAKAPGPA